MSGKVRSTPSSIVHLLHGINIEGCLISFRFRFFAQGVASLYGAAAGAENEQVGLPKANDAGEGVDIGVWCHARLNKHYNTHVWHV